MRCTRAESGGVTLAVGLALDADECIAYLEQRAETYRVDSWRQTEREARLARDIAAALDRVAQELREVQQARANGS